MFKFLQMRRCILFKIDGLCSAFILNVLSFFRCGWISRLDNFLFIRYITITQETHLVIEIQNFDVSNEPYCGRKYLNGKNCLILKEGY